MHFNGMWSVIDTDIQQDWPKEITSAYPIITNIIFHKVYFSWCVIILVSKFASMSVLPIRIAKAFSTSSIFTQKSNFYPALIKNKKKGQAALLTKKPQQLKDPLRNTRTSTGFKLQGQQVGRKTAGYCKWKMTHLCTLDRIKITEQRRLNHHTTPHLEK